MAPGSSRTAIINPRGELIEPRHDLHCPSLDKLAEVHLSTVDGKPTKLCQLRIASPVLGVERDGRGNLALPAVAVG